MIKIKKNPAVSVLLLLMQFEFLPAVMQFSKEGRISCGSLEININKNGSVKVFLNYGRVRFLLNKKIVLTQILK
ncbi:MAG TPA: hypothetical protein DC049_13140, partial [Spirochaetia bacterium]|nr:hypothetical protein [Spirochaetia bacterium]